MFYLVYKITNKINHKFYIGAHKTKNKDDGYMGSSEILKDAIKKYGKQNFTKEILYEAHSLEEMYLKEKDMTPAIIFIKDSDECLTSIYNFARIIRKKEEENLSYL